MDSASRRVCRELWSKFNLITVRDEQASAFLRSIGIEHTLLPCPSIFAYEPVRPPNAGSVIVIDAPLWNETLRPAKLPTIEGARQFQYENGVYQEADVVSLLDLIAQYEWVVSARVHAAVPLMAVRAASIVPMDSRALTAKLVGIPAFPGRSTPENGKSIRESASAEYRRLLSPFIVQRTPDGTSPTLLPTISPPS
jgi:hypothetical protein